MSDKTNIESGFKEYSKADTPGNNSRVVLIVAGVVGTFINDSETKDESPSMTETYSGIKVEPSLKGSLWILYGNSRSVALIFLQKY